MNSTEIVNILIKLGTRIKEIRNSKDITQARLSEMCNIQKSSISKIEAGRNNITMATLNCIATALEVNLFDFFKDAP
ncbi:MAG: helix-turn-helix transcriptional regulator [Chitinophagaceae bacterium]